MTDTVDSLSRDDFLRYSRHLLMADIGEQGQAALLAARVLVVGVGGLGSPVSLYLAAAGVGYLGLCDPDVVDLTNLQRQVLFTTADKGKPKVECAGRALAALNPGITVRGFRQQVDDSLFESPHRYDLVMDCTDNLAARHWLNRCCQRRRIPLISAAALGWEGQLMSFDFARQPSPCLACAIPEGQGEPLANCANSGVVGPVLGVMGSLQAIAAIRLLLAGAGVATLPETCGVLQRFDGRREQWHRFRITANPDCPVCRGS